jgi:hypothetical protein
MLRLAEQHMKSRILWSWGLGVVVAALLLAGGILRKTSEQATNTAPALESEANAEAADLAAAAVKPISPRKPLPANVQTTGPVSEVIKLADSGVEESVMLAFVANSTSPFNLGVEDIICLNDLGVPGSVVTAMMQRDQALKELSASAAPVPAAPASDMPANQFASEPGTPTSYALQPPTAPAPPEMEPEGAPPGDYAAESYPPPPAADTGYSTSYDSPAPSGTWVDAGGYGPSWRPTVVVVNPPTATGAIRTISTVGSNPALRSVAPLILHGPDRPGLRATGWSAGAVRGTYPPNALVIIGSREAHPRQTTHPSAVWTPEAPRSRPTAFAPDAWPQPVAEQKPQSVRTAAWARPARSEPAWSAPRPAVPPVRSEHQRPYAAPSRNGR